MALKNTYKVIGVMSGTSLDGLDIAFCHFTKRGAQWMYTIQAATTIAYKEEQKRMLATLMQVSAEKLAEADMVFGKFIGAQVKRFIQAKKLKVDFISSHGHTIFHQPERGFTCQIGSGAAIHAICNVPVVADLRTVDVTLGGQGAPLVPIGDKLLFKNYHFCLNLGGISNISFDYKKKRIAFDISPVNIVMNNLAEAKGMAFDKDGKLAASGQINQDLLKALNRLSFYQDPFPKSLGKEWIDTHVFPLLKNSGSSVEDQLATFCEHIAIQIQIAINKTFSKNLIKNSSMLITGGGAFNKFLIKRIKEHLEPGKIAVVVPEKHTVLFKEALIFAFLGVLRVRNENNALSSVTGASRDNIGGALYGKIPR